MRIVLLGAPGAGKGTQCKRIVDQYSLQHLSSGDILRKERYEGTDFGKEAQSYMDSGALVPDGLIVEMMSKAIKDFDGKGFVLDGFPRTVNQAAELDKALELSGQKIDTVLNLEIDDRIVVDRITGRRSCPECGAVYHIENMKPKQDGICDNDGTELVQRPDDVTDVVKNRLKNYHQQTMPVVDYYKGNNTVHSINADDDVEKIIKKIYDILNVLS